MKKRLTVIIFAFTLLLTMAGCSAANTLHKITGVGDRIEATADAAENRLEDIFLEAVSPAPAAVPTESVPAQLLTEEQALQVALDYLGITSEQVTGLRVAYEVDDAIPQFDVEFIQGDWEYEFEIHAESGKIISYDKDHKYD